MKLTVLFLFLAVMIATNAIFESIKKMLSDVEMTDALNRQHMTYVWADLTYGALR